MGTFARIEEFSGDKDAMGVFRAAGMFVFFKQMRLIQLKRKELCC